MLKMIPAPDLGTDSAEVIEILVKVGDILAIDTPIVLLESAKASMEVPSPMAGVCLLYTSPSPRDRTRSRMPSSA